MLFFCHTDLFHGRINLFFDIILFSVIDSYVSPPPCITDYNLDHVMKTNKGSSTLTITYRVLETLQAHMSEQKS